jgi:alpha-L-fucosidase
MTLRSSAVLFFLSACVLLPAQQPPAEARFAPERGFGMGPAVDAAAVDRAVAATAPIPAGPVAPTWESIGKNYQVPDWFRDGKFGLFIHWGLYSVPAFHNEWYEKYLYGNAEIRDWHIKTFGPLDQFGYLKFADRFATKFDPAAWAELFAAAGATYVVPTAEHHDWFSLWDSQVTPWNAARIGPKRDLIGELAAAVRARGLKFGVSNHSIEHYTFINQRPPAGMKSDLDDPALADFYWVDHGDAQLDRFLRLWLEKNFELIDKYQPDMLWFDNGINHRAYDPMKLKVAAYYYNRAATWGKPVTLSTKAQAFLAGSVLDFERQGRAPKQLTDFVWQPDDPIGPTFGYTTAGRGRGDRTQDMPVTEPGVIIGRLVMNVSRNGNYLLNISPRGDGTIPENQQAVLRAIGAWLKVNGEAIYRTRPWTRSEEGRVHFTRHGDTLYAIALDWPAPELRLACLGTEAGSVARVELLGHPGALAFTQDAAGLHVQLPAAKPTGLDHAYALKITGLKL